MKTSAKLTNLAVPLFMLLAFFTVNSYAAIDNAGVLNNVLNRYQSAASTWSEVITTRATWLFWTLATISMVWTFGMMALRKADIGEFFAEFIRFTVFTGFFWWLLLNGPNFATSIMDSLRQIGGMAAGTSHLLTPSGIVDIGFDIYSKVLDQSSVWSPVDSVAGVLLGIAILVILALIGVNMLLLLVSGWILAYAGIFFLGFGGSRWTSEMAIGYFKTVLGIAAQLFTMVLLVGIGKSFIDQYYVSMSSGLDLKEMGVMLVVSVVLLALINKVPPLIGGLAGGNTGALGQGFGAGAAVSAAVMGAAAVSTVGAALMSGAASMGGAAQALMAAVSKASAAESAGGGGAGDLMAAMGNSGGNDGGGGASLASAMGDVGSGANMNTGSSSASDFGNSSFGAGNTVNTGSSPGEVKSGGAMAAAGAAAANVGRIAAGTASNLAKGSIDVGKAKMGNLKNAALDRISETTGGKIASAIKARNTASGSGSTASAVFDSNSLSAGTTTQSVDANSEVAAFRDRDLKST